MVQLEAYVRDKNEWILIGSSLGGAMAALYAAQHPDQVKKLILLAPALHIPEIMHTILDPVFIPTILIIGTRDKVVPINTVLQITKRIFPRLTILSVEDDHRLHDIVDQLDWKSLLV